MVIQWETVITALIAALGAALAAYGFRRREARLDRVLKLIDEAQTDLLGPMFKEIRAITRNKDDRKATDENLSAFFTKYNAPTSKIHLFSSKLSGLNLYLEADDAFHAYVTEPSNLRRQVAWTAFEKLSEAVEGHFWRNHETVFREHEAHRRRLDESAFAVALEDSMRLLAHVSAGLLFSGVVVAMLALLTWLLVPDYSFPPRFWRNLLWIEGFVAFFTLMVNIGLYANLPDYYERPWYQRLATRLHSLGLSIVGKPFGLIITLWSSLRNKRPQRKRTSSSAKD